MKLEPEKDFIKLNAGKNVLKSNVDEEYINKWMIFTGGKSLTVPEKRREDYGQVPKYLNRIKENIENNFNMLKEMKMKEEEMLKKEK